MVSFAPMSSEVSESNRMLYYSFLKHPTGTLSLITTEEGLEEIRFDATYPSDAERCGDHPILRETARQLDAYFTRDLRDFDLPLILKGTPFQVRAWQALRLIPYGTTRSYAEQARAIGAPDAVRAVGAANGR